MHTVITGANRGIGLELVRQCLARGDTVHAGVREPPQAGALHALAAGAGGRLHVYALDVASEPSVRAFAHALPGPVDLLLNNAGRRTRPDELEGMDFEDLARTFEVNALGALRVTGALLPRLGPGSRVASLGSNLGSLAGNTSGGDYGYRMSKAALGMATRSLAADLRERGVLVVVLSPGWVRTDMGGTEAPTSVQESAAGLLSLLGRLSLQESGGFFDFRGERIPW